MANRVLRWLSAALLILYGFAKINGSQFTILDSELDKPMGQVSGFWLTWYYFGYSQAYGWFLALAQIGGALLLTMDRTALLGACLLLPVLGNILLIDIAYQVDLSATVVALFLLVVVISVIVPRLAEIQSLFLPPSTSGRARFIALAWIGRLGLLAFACGFTYWIANFNNRDPTRIDGAWDVMQVEPDSLAQNAPTAIFFEHNRAHMSVLKFKGGVYETQEFKAGRDEPSVAIWKRDSKEGSTFAGTYTISGNDLTLAGAWIGVEGSRFVLRRRQVR